MQRHSCWSNPGYGASGQYAAIQDEVDFGFQENTPRALLYTSGFRLLGRWLIYHIGRFVIVSLKSASTKYRGSRQCRWLCRSTEMKIRPAVVKPNRIPCFRRRRPSQWGNAACNCMAWYDFQPITIILLLKHFVIENSHCLSALEESNFMWMEAEYVTMSYDLDSSPSWPGWWGLYPDEIRRLLFPWCWVHVK